ncbi:MAG: hypothetical protein FD138_2339 [Planctomycetota bacterium]|nr:MAG: hypothetical protein FD138_2339 [Planctomycetota bacterium]
MTHPADWFSGWKSFSAVDLLEMSQVDSQREASSIGMRDEVGPLTTRMADRRPWTTTRARAHGDDGPTQKRYADDDFKPSRLPSSRILSNRTRRASCRVTALIHLPGLIGPGCRRERLLNVLRASDVAKACFLANSKLKQLEPRVSHECYLLIGSIRTGR